MFLTEYDEKKVLEMEREEGRAEGESRLGSLINALIRSGRNNDVLRASTDDGYRKQFYQELNIQ